MMKCCFSLLAACALVLPASQSAQAQAASVNFFYDNLSGGNWYEVDNFGYVWQPDAAGDPSWRPYTDGYWAYTDLGWTWVSYEDFGWATYHYGRWTRLADYGWCWVPGYEWAPAWVSWRTGGDYIGWAPLPPVGPDGEVVYEGQPITGRVDVEFGIGPAAYNFIDIRYIGEPVLRSRILDYNENAVYLGKTVNVTSIISQDGRICDFGPDYAVVSRYSMRPVPHLTIERDPTDPNVAVKRNMMSKVQGDKLMLAAPWKLSNPSQVAAPPVIKGKIDQPKFERGWSSISDAKVRAQLERRLQTENLNKIPEPSFKPRAARSSAFVASPAPATLPGESVRGRRRSDQPLEGGASSTPGALENSTRRKPKSIETIPGEARKPSPTP